MSNAIEMLAEFKKKLDSFLEQYFRNGFSGQESELSVDYNSSIAQFILNGGKRLRPALFYYTYVFLNDHESNDIFELSIFLEFIQAFLLIHDDIIDASELRRGKPTVHVVYEKLALSKGYPDPKRYGEMVALLVGNIAYQYINKIIIDSNLSIENKLALIRLCSQKIEEVLVGQIEDFNLSLIENFTEEDIKKVQQDKTVTYSFELPIEAAIVLSQNTGQETIESLRKIAQYTGLAFQIQDDVLGLFGDEEKTGKSIYTDLIEGKKTYLIWDTLKSASYSEKEFVLKNIGNKNSSIEELEKVRSIIKKSGALEKSKSNDAVKILD
ncbi:MAG: geranylgeranyl pyrophosphate synthase [Candidatus Dojkabacteria bacterium]|nr:MAG: geranylgeranyl pyrophosphate synthase [Candidatus Dojkabacteria bacterium]